MENQCVHKDGSKSTYLPPTTPSQEETARLDVPSWEANEIDAPLQTAKCWGYSLLDQLFKQIDEIEDDFHTIVALLLRSEDKQWRI